MVDLSKFWVCFYAGYPEGSWGLNGRLARLYLMRWINSYYKGDCLLLISPYHPISPYHISRLLHVVTVYVIVIQNGLPSMTFWVESCRIPNVYYPLVSSLPGLENPHQFDDFYPGSIYVPLPCLRTPESDSINSNHWAINTITIQFYSFYHH